MSEQEQTDNIVILVDFNSGKGSVIPIGRGGKEVDQKKLQELTGKSKKAVENALGAIGWVAKQAKDALSGLKIHEKPAQMELEFGIQITAEAGVVVAKGSTQLHITAKLIWDNTNVPEEKSTDHDDTN